METEKVLTFEQIIKNTNDFIDATFSNHTIWTEGLLKIQDTINENIKLCNARYIYNSKLDAILDMSDIAKLISDLGATECHPFDGAIYNAAELLAGRLHQNCLSRDTYFYEDTFDQDLWKKVALRWLVMELIEPRIGKKKSVKRLLKGFKTTKLAKPAWNTSAAPKDKWNQAVDQLILEIGHKPKKTIIKKYRGI